MRSDDYVFDLNDVLVENLHLVLLTEHMEWIEFCECIDRYSYTLDEGMLDRLTGAIKSKINFLKDLAGKLGVNFLELAKVFKNSQVFKFFTRIGWNITKLWKLLNTGFHKLHDVLDVIAEFIAKTKVGKWTEDKLKQLDDFLQKHPKTKRIAGIAVAGILAFIWFNMTFTGSFEYDFGMDDLIAALAGNLTLASIFGGKNGVKLLMLFATGFFGGITFPWPGPAKIQFIGGILHTLVKKLNIRAKLGMVSENKPVIKAGRSKLGRLEKFMVAEGINDKGIFKAVFLAGHPGAGKTTVLTKVKSGSIEPRWVNTDKVFPLFKEWWNSDWPKVSEKVKTISKNQLAGYINSMLPLAIDGTAAIASTVMRRKHILESFGYDTAMIFINTSLETSIERALERQKKIGREVKPEFIKSIYNDIQKHKNFYRGKFDTWMEVDNNDGELTDQVIINTFKFMGNFYGSPIQNPIGQEKIEEMKENGWKYLDPNITSIDIIKSTLSGWY